MGLDYDYKLRFKREQLGEILLAVADASQPNENPPLEVILPGGAEVISLPFSLLWPKVSSISCDAEDFQDFLSFGTSLWFESDALLERYAKAQAAEGHPLRRDEQGRLNIGYVYLTVMLKSQPGRPRTPETEARDRLPYLDFTFTPATSQMSLLFAGSESVRRFFISLLEQHNGIRGEFHDSDYGWGPITIWPETAPDYNPANLLDLHDALAPDTPYHRFPMKF